METIEVEVDPSEGGFDPERLDQLGAHLHRYVDDGRLPGTNVLVSRGGKVVYHDVYGYRDIERSLPVESDTIYRFYSMTKPVTSLATMMLVEAGELSLDTAAREYLPEYGNMAVISDLDLINKSYSTKALSREIIIADLLTNTAGFGYEFCNEILFAFDEPGDSTNFPLLHQPGEAWTYRLATKLLGDIITKVKGQSLEAALMEMVFSPLGMDKTSYEIRDNQAFPHVNVDGSWQPIDLWPFAPRGDGGLVSTAHDYARFLQCLLNDGEPLVSASTFESMISNQIGELVVTEQPAANIQLTHPFPTGAGIDKCGYGFQLSMAEDNRRRKGSYSWCG